MIHDIARAKQLKLDIETQTQDHLILALFLQNQNEKRNHVKDLFARASSTFRRFSQIEDYFEKFEDDAPDITPQKLEKVKQTVAPCDPPKETVSPVEQRTRQLLEKFRVKYGFQPNIFMRMLDRA